MTWELVLVLFGAVLGGLFFWIVNRLKVGSYTSIAKDILQKAELDATALRHAKELESKQRQMEQQREWEQTLQNEKRKLNKEEERLQQREDKLESRIQSAEKKLSELEKRELKLSEQRQQLDVELQKIALLQTQLTQKLESLSGLSADEARTLLVTRMADEVKHETAHLIRRSKQEAEETAEREASRIIATAIGRLAVPCVSDATINTVALPNDEMKGRIIGREGRNIRALEQATGITFLIDDTPGAIVLSGYDPVRMHIAKLALTDLIADGRIHPTRIEEAMEKANGSIGKQIKHYGEDAALRAGIMNLHPEIITLLGKLKFRYSYGQNILEHSLEVSHLMGIIAAELGLDVALAKRIGLLHDMGKAVSHEMEGSHAIIGHDLALKYGEIQNVANGIGCHHNEMPPITIEGSFCGAADAISASRPGARIEALEEYIKRLKKLEEIACQFQGVEKAFALQAGREVRIVVQPDALSDDALIHLARDVTKRIEKEVSYPGKVKVTVIREKRVVEYAL